MQNMNLPKWSSLSDLQIGDCGESFAKIEFLLYGFDVYTTKVDEHGVDFVAEKNGKFYHVQVKAVRDTPANIMKDKIVLNDKYLVCYLRFHDGQMPEIYVFPATVFANPLPPFSSRDYNGKSSKPEYSISPAKKHTTALQKYMADIILPTL